MTPATPNASTREALVDAAERLLDEGGQPAVTLRAVAGLVGVSHNAPYKHFASREALLAAVAVRELERHGTVTHPDLRSRLQGRVAWAIERPQRFQLIFGPWQSVTPELVDVATSAAARLYGTVEEAQARGELPAGDPQRLAALLNATAHGAAALAAAGHLARDGKGHASAADLVDDLLAHLRSAAGVEGRTDA